MGAPAGSGPAWNEGRAGFLDGEGALIGNRPLIGPFRSHGGACRVWAATNFLSRCGTNCPQPRLGCTEYVKRQARSGGYRHGG
jgi:hypothetical protein